MILKTINSSLVILTLVVSIIVFTPSAFAETFTVVKGDVNNQACASTNNCFTPNPVNVKSGDTVTWTDPSTGSPHTVTSGKQDDNSTGNDKTGAIFDSGFLASGQTFSHTFTATELGTINYFDEIHPWMTGQIIVTAAGTNNGGTNQSATGNNNAVPEFGPIASLVLVMAIVSVVAVTAKTRGFLKL